MMTITVSPRIERALTVEAARRGTTPDLLAEEILISSLAAGDETALSPSSDEVLNGLIAKAQTLELPAMPSSASDTPFGEAIIAKYRKQGFTL